MAGDWIPVRKGLKDELEVMRIATLTGLSCRVVVSILIDFWGWVDSVTDDGILKGVTLAEMSRFCPDVVPQFWDALAQVGWMRLSDTGIEIPNFYDWFGPTAKHRLKEARRKRNYRRGGRNVPYSADKVGTKLGQNAGPQNRTEQNRGVIPPLPPSLDTPEIRTLWDQWQQHRREIRHPLTTTAAKRQLAKLEEMGPARAAASLSHSIANGYQGIFEPGVSGGRAAANGRSETIEEQFARVRARKEAQQNG